MESITRKEKFYESKKDYLMQKEIIENKEFNKVDFTAKKLPSIEFENCSFLNCKMSDLDLSGYTFLDCEFQGCDLSNSKLKGTSFKDVKFHDCKLLGLLFNNCSELLLSFTFVNCQMNLTSFHLLKIKGIEFIECNLTEADFSDADLTKVKFNNCDLSRAIFNYSNLEGADFRTSYNFSIDPELNKMKKAKFSLNNATGLLDKYNIIIE